MHSLKKGGYIIKAKDRDINNDESDWAVFEVTMPKTYNYTPMIQLMLKTLECIPFFEKILNL